MEKIINGKTVKITRVGRLYIDGRLTMTMSEGAPTCDRITPVNLPPAEAVGEEIVAHARAWAAKNYRMVK